MPIQVDCENCGRSLRVKDELAGRRAKCPGCSEAILIPSSSSSHPKQPAAKKRPAAPKSSAPKPSAAKLRQRPRKSRPRKSDNSFDTAAAPPARRRRSGSKTATGRKKSPGKRSKSKSKLPLILGGSAVVVVLLCSGAIWAVWSSISSMRTVADLGDPAGPIPFADVALPQFPDPGSPVRNFPSGVRTYFVDLGQTNDASQASGFGMKMRIYRPGGDHTPKSLPCVLVAPAGTNLLVGNDMDADDYHDETLPYAENGIVTIFFSIDGGVGDMESASDAQFVSGYKKFRAARAGLVNGRNALEYALAKLPEVDPRRIYCAGHSSAGTLSLLLASHEKRIAGCIAYAPCSNVEHFLADITADAAASFLLPGVAEFIKRSSPKNHASRLTCPLFVFHAGDDDICPVAESESYVQAVGTPRHHLEFVRVPGGGHYQPMIDDGIPAAIRKIQEWAGSDQPPP